MKKPQYYIKKKGRYIPVLDCDFFMGYGVGDYLVRVRNGSRSLRVIKTGISIDAAKVELAMAEMADVLAMAIIKHSESKPRITGLSEVEIRAFKEYENKTGRKSITYTAKSASEIAELAMQTVKLKMGKKTPCPEGCADIFAEKGKK